MVRARKGIEAAAELRERWRHQIGVAIQRRKAAMIRSTMPGRPASQEWLERGGRVPGSMLPPLDEDQIEEEEEEQEQNQEVSE